MIRITKGTLMQLAQGNTGGKVHKAFMAYANWCSLEHIRNRDKLPAHVRCYYTEETSTFMIGLTWDAEVRDK